MNEVKVTGLDASTDYVMFVTAVRIEDGVETDLANGTYVTTLMLPSNEPVFPKEKVTLRAVSESIVVTFVPAHP